MFHITNSPSLNKKTNSLDKHVELTSAYIQAFPLDIFLSEDCIQQMSYCTCPCPKWISRPSIFLLLPLTTGWYKNIPGKPASTDKTWLKDNRFPLPMYSYSFRTHSELQLFKKFFWITPSEKRGTQTFAGRLFFGKDNIQRVFWKTQNEIWAFMFYVAFSF